MLYQVDHTWLRLEPVEADDRIFECELCRRESPRSVRGICTTLGCGGKLVPVTSAGDDHYRHLYRTLNPVPMKAREHTAQLTSDEAADVQQQFVRGEVNALSCSTTFELGVDVGELQSVVMRNMPPTTANYVQRAGRAGRRTDSAALVLTYAQRRSHDLSRFQDPKVMVSGEVRSPYVPLGNDRIDRRHAHSVALAAFFRDAKEQTGETWSKAGAFFLGDAGTRETGVAVPFAGARGDHGVAAASAARKRTGADRRRDKCVGGRAVFSAGARADGAGRGCRRL